MGSFFAALRLDFEHDQLIVSTGTDVRTSDEHDSVVWLQEALSELGLYDGAPSGQYDASTVRGVRVLQSDAFLEPSGTLDERTQIVLFSKLPRYSVPRLREQGGAG